MRGFELILGYLLGNETARKWCISKICETSCLIDKEILSKIKTEDKKDDNIRNDA